MKTLPENRVPEGPLKNKWTQHKQELKAVPPSLREKYTVVVVGAGLSGSSAAVALGELGFKVKLLFLQDSPSRCQGFSAHELIPYPCNPESIEYLFLKTISHGNFRAREADVYRMHELTKAAVDLCVAEGVPFDRDESGYLRDYSARTDHESTIFYTCRETKQQFLLAAHRALMQGVAQGNIELLPRCEMLDLVIVNERAKGIVFRDLTSGAIESQSADAVVLAPGGYSNIFAHSTNGKSSHVTALWHAYKRGAVWANPGFIQFYPFCTPQQNKYQSKADHVVYPFNQKLRFWVPKNKEDDTPPAQTSKYQRDYFLENDGKDESVPHDVAARKIKEQLNLGNGIGPKNSAVYLDVSDKLLMVSPAANYSLGGLWVDYNLMSTIPGLFVIGEANFSSHGAQYLGANTLMQNLTDGRLILPHTLNDYLSRTPPIEGEIENLPAFKQSEAYIIQKLNRLISIKGKRTAFDFHRQLGYLMWDACGIFRNKVNLDNAAVKIREIREEFWENILVPGTNESFNQSLEQAARVADFLEFSELMIIDALNRSESCGCHFREESQIPKGEIIRHSERSCNVACWEFESIGTEPVLHKEPLVYDNIKRNWNHNGNI